MRKALYILGDLTEEDVIFLAKVGEIVQFNADDVVIQAGVEVKALYFLTSGAMNVRLGNGDIVASFGVGDVAGEMSFIENRPPEADVVATEACRLLAVSRTALNNELEQNPAFASRFYKALATFLSDRLRATTAMTAGSNSSQDELDERLLDIVHVAGDRMLRLIELMDKQS